ESPQFLAPALIRNLHADNSLSKVERTGSLGDGASTRQRPGEHWPFSCRSTAQAGRHNFLQCGRRTFHQSHSHAKFRFCWLKELILALPIESVDRGFCLTTLGRPRSHCLSAYLVCGGKSRRTKSSDSSFDCRLPSSRASSTRERIYLNLGPGGYQRVM